MTTTRPSNAFSDAAQLAFGALPEVVEPPIATPAHNAEHRQRLRERFMRAGVEALADYELLELVLFRAIPRRDVKPLAKDLLHRFGDFNQLLFAQTQCVHNRIGVFIQPDTRHHFGGRTAGFVPVDHAAVAAFVAQKNILGDRQKRHQRQFLMNDDDPVIFAIADIGKGFDLIVIDDVASIGAMGIYTRQDLHQGRLTRTVFTNKRVDFTLGHGQVDLIQRFYTGKFLGDRTHFKNSGHVIFALT